MELHKKIRNTFFFVLARNVGHRTIIKKLRIATNTENPNLIL